MSSIGQLVQGAQGLTAGGYLFAGGAVLTLYDYLLMFDDEIQYVWRGRKTWISYLYITNRVLLVGLQFWQIYYISGPSRSKAFCLRRYHVQVVAAPFFIFFSAIFITLRIYALTSKNKILVVYFGSTALAMLVVSLASNLIEPPAVVDPPSTPIDVFKLCRFIPNYQFKIVPHSIVTAFDFSAFLVIVLYACRNRRALKFSALIRGIVAEATIHFTAMVIAQTCIQLSFIFMESVSQRFLYTTYGIIVPILTLRFAVSLKRSADPDGGEEWGTSHFSSDIEVDHIGPLNDWIQTAEATDRCPVFSVYTAAVDQG